MTVPGGFEARVRESAIVWLERRTRDGAEAVSTLELGDFAVDGGRVRLMDAQRGIWKPRNFAAALSIRTTYRPPGRPRPYEDIPGDDGLLRYMWRGTDPSQADNRALRHGLQDRHGQPLMTVPRQKAERPDRALLEMSYAAFRSGPDAEP